MGRSSLVARARAALLAIGAALAIGASEGACALGNVSRSDCASDAQCVSAFGPGSACSAGYCSEPASCTTGHDCRKQVGGGACDKGVCVATFPKDPACSRIAEPADLLDQPSFGPDAPLLIGGIFSLDEDHDEALTRSIRLAVREINRTGGLDRGQKLGVVFCDNGGPKNSATGDERKELNAHAIDYLAGTLGAPVIIGPLTSSDSIQLVNELKKKSLPTVVISPSATSPALTMIDDRLSPGDMYGLFWRTCPSDELQGSVLANQVIGADSTITKVTVIYIRDAYGEGLATVFQGAYGIGKTTLVPYDDTTPDDPAALAALANTADAAGGDAVLLIALHGNVAIKIIEAMEGKAIATKPWFFTDGSQDSDLIDKGTPPWVQSLVKAAKGTAPAQPNAGNLTYKLFDTNLQSEFGITGTSFSFLAQAYDATYVGAYGITFAAKDSFAYDGLGVAAGMALLSAGTQVNVGSLDWLKGQTALTTAGAIDIGGTSGPLHFDPTTGEAPGPILVWGVAPDLSGYTSINVIQPN